MDIYTRTGDDGTSGTLGQGRRLKEDLVFHALGDLDELNACLGQCGTLLGVPACQIRTVQSELLSLGAEVASFSADPRFLFELASDATERLEREIDEAESGLPTLTAFILPGGSPGAASLHLARAVCRRAERSLVALRHAEPTVRLQGVKYVNRLSDWLFVMARHENRCCGVADVVWEKQ
ncbi:MAG: cob(I)yrinic acid a,c-diamide adenosyltransferase [Armatimonadetes bacterium]|nr:cob(I)yrinic acid a,c-diamide adenosyltransferase [Armatimonadota bacterium]